MSSVGGGPATVLANYTYDGMGRRVRKVTDAGVTTNYLFDGLALLAETDGAGVIKRTYNPGISVTDDKGNKFFFLSDGRGNTAGLLDNNANIVQSYSYDAFGALRIGADKFNGLRNVGQFGVYSEDDTGLINMWNRWYDPNTGRFVSEDPIRWESDNANMFGYVQNNPVNFTDPRGLKLSVDEVTNVVFNEFRSLSGNGLDTAYWHMASVVWNGDERQDRGGRGSKRPQMASSTAGPPKEETGIWGRIWWQASNAKINRFGDSCSGPFHYNFRNDNNLVRKFQGNLIRSQDGPFDNDYPTSAGGEMSTKVWMNTYD